MSKNSVSFNIVDNVSINAITQLFKLITKFDYKTFRYDGVS